MSVLPNPQEIATLLIETAASLKTAKVDVFGLLLPRMIERFPQLKANGDAYRLLSEAIDLLEAKGTITKPKGRKLYDSRGHHQYPLPVYVTKTATREVKERESVTWHPLLAGADRVIHPARRAMLTEINTYLIERPEGLLDVVPAQERSLMIFGADKRFAGFTSIPLPDGRSLTMDDLGFKPAEPPLAYTACPKEGSSDCGLIVENAAAYDTFCAWNARTGRFRAVVFGGGTSLLKATTRLDQIANRHGVGSWEYFGDIDAEGMRIPTTLAERNRDECRINVIPLAAAYAWLVKHGRFVPDEHVTKAGEEQGKWLLQREAAVEWVGNPEVIRAVDDSVESGTLIPQEWLGSDVLSKADEIDECLPPPPYLPPRFRS